MPNYIVKFTPTGRFLRFDEPSGDFKMASMGEATAFPSREKALEKIFATAKALRKAKRDHDLPGWARVACGLTVSVNRQITYTNIHGCFETQARPSFEDIAGVMEIHYVHSASAGWLCRSWRKSDEGRICWAENFGLAIGYADVASAQAACRELGGGDDSCIVTAKSVFVSAKPMSGAASVIDPVRDGIRAACEAREISSEIDQSAKERLEAMAQAAEASVSKKRARL